MNYAVKYYDLKENPCRKDGTIGKDHADEMQIWTTEEFKKFLEKISDNPHTRAGFLPSGHCRPAGSRESRDHTQHLLAPVPVQAG